MNKELEALNELRYGGLVKDDVICFTKKAFEKRLDIIETALKEGEDNKRLYINAIKQNGELTIKYQNKLDQQAKKLKVLELIEENLKYGYVFIGYDKDGKPLFQFADTKLYEEIKKNLIY